MSDSDKSAESIDHLFSNIDPREQASDDARQRAHAAALETFEAIPAARSRVQTGLAAAVGMIAAGMIGWLLVSEPPPDLVQAATISYASGGYYIGGGSAGRDDNTHDRTLFNGSEVTTGENGRLMLQMGPGTSVRLDKSTSVSLIDAGRLELTKGRIYVDAWLEDAPLSVVSGSIEIRRVGTQFTAEREDDALTVAVREGRVNLATPETTVSAKASEGEGERVSLKQGRLQRRESVSTLDQAEWAWIAAAQGGFEAEGRSLYDYLSWVARETGRELVVERRAERIAKSEVDLAWGRTPIRAASLQDYLAAASTPLAEVEGVAHWELKISVAQ